MGVVGFWFVFFFTSAFTFKTDVLYEGFVNTNWRTIWHFRSVEKGVKLMSRSAGSHDYS